MTWCLSSSIFDEARCPKVVAADTLEADSFQSLILFVSLSFSLLLFLHNTPLPCLQSSTITAGWANTNIYCRSGSGRNVAWLTETVSQSGSCATHGWDLCCGASGWSRAFFSRFKFDSLKRFISKLFRLQFCFIDFSLKSSRGVHGTESEHVLIEASCPPWGKGFCFGLQFPRPPALFVEVQKGRLLWMTGALVQFPRCAL